jgi:hypothetical protein
VRRNKLQRELIALRTPRVEIFNGQDDHLLSYHVIIILISPVNLLVAPLQAVTLSEVGQAGNVICFCILKIFLKRFNFF